MNTYAFSHSLHLEVRLCLLDTGAELLLQSFQAHELIVFGLKEQVLGLFQLVLQLVDVRAGLVQSLELKLERDC